MSEIALKFLAANVGAGLAILAVLALRKPVRAMFGASLAYALWLLVPVVALASLLPPRTIEIAQPAVEAATDSVTASILPEVAVPASPVDVVRSDTAPGSAPTPVMPAAAPAQIVSVAPRLPSIDPWALAAVIWFAGVVVALAWQLRNQSRFMADARRGVVGPAVAGFLRPHIVTPTDFEQRFDARERAVILAHEMVHLTRNDARINALVALARCLCWFNPLIHAGAHVMRIDQELACDAAVTERHPRERAVYASALLKAQLASRPLPLGCYWPAKAAHTLVERIEMLDLAQPGKRARLAGLGVLAVFAIGSGAVAWAAKPPVARPAAIQASSASDQPAPAPQAPSRTAAYDPADPVYLRGKVERIDFSDTKYTVFVRASSLATSEFDEPKPDTRLWELTPTSFWGDRDAVNADLKDSNVLVRGYNAKDKSCKPACKLLTRGIVTPKSTALAAPAPSALFGVSEVMRAYNMDQDYSAEGRVQRIEFSERTFDAYIATAANGPVPGRVFQVRSEYRFPRAEIERELNNQVVQVKGWPVRGGASRDIEMWSIYATCETVCAMYGTDFTREDGAKIAPAGDQLLPTPVTTDPFFVRLPSMARRETGVALTGKVREVRSDWGIELVVEETSRSPTAFTGPQPGTLWTVWFGPPPGAFGWSERTNPLNTVPMARSMIGHTITFSGTIGPYRGGSNVRTCQTDCRFLAQNIMIFE